MLFQNAGCDVPKYERFRNGSKQNNQSFYSITKYVNLKKGDPGQVKPNSRFAGSKHFYI